MLILLLHRKMWLTPPRKAKSIVAAKNQAISIRGIPEINQDSMQRARLSPMPS